MAGLAAVAGLLELGVKGGVLARKLMLPLPEGGVPLLPYPKAEGSERRPLGVPLAVMLPLGGVPRAVMLPLGD